MNPRTAIKLLLKMVQTISDCLEELRCEGETNSTIKMRLHCKQLRQEMVDYLDV